MLFKTTGEAFTVDVAKIAIRLFDPGRVTKTLAASCIAEEWRTMSMPFNHTFEECWTMSMPFTPTLEECWTMMTPFRAAVA